MEKELKQSLAPIVCGAEKNSKIVIGYVEKIHKNDVGEIPVTVGAVKRLLRSYWEEIKTIDNFFLETSTTGSYEIRMKPFCFEKISKLKNNLNKAEFDGENINNEVMMSVFGYEILIGIDCAWDDNPKTKVDEWDEASQGGSHRPCISVTAENLAKLEALYKLSEICYQEELKKVGKKIKTVTKGKVLTLKQLKDMIQNLGNIPRLKTEIEQIDDLIKRFGESFKVTVQVGCFYYPDKVWDELVEKMKPK
jgi:hypothetical protein